MTEIALSDILRIEEAPELLDLACEETGISVWPQVRIWLLRQILGDLIFVEGGAPDMPMRRPPPRAISTLARSMLHNRRTLASDRLSIDLLITTEASAEQLREGAWFNRQADHFAEAAADARLESLVLLDQHEWTWPFPRANPGVYFHAPLQLGTSAAGRLFPGRNTLEAAEKLAELATLRARDVLGWEACPERTTSFIRYIARKLATTAPRYRAYRRLLGKTQPKLLLSSSACYGHIATMVAAARDEGIPVAEYQHGAVSEGHDAYNFGDAVRADARLHRVLPDYFLSYGDWWNAHFNVPVKKVTIGYPNRKVGNGSWIGTAEKPRTILILSDGLEFLFYARLAEEVAREAAPLGYSVLLRPHPLERNEVLHSWSPSAANLALDTQPDIYASITRVAAVISEVSTGLFEAVGLADRVLMLDSKKSRFAYPSPPFPAATAAPELVALAAGQNTTRTAVGVDELWAIDWKANFTRFLRQKIEVS